MPFLVEEGKLDTNRPVPHYLPRLAGTSWDDVSVLESMEDGATGDIVLPD